MRNSLYAAWCIGAIIAAAAPKAAAVTTVVTSDALDLASAFAPSPGAATVTGNFVEVSNASQIGTFTDGGGTIGINSGIILSSGNISEIGIGAVAPLSTSFAGSPNASTNALLNQIPGLSSVHGDTVRFSLGIDAGIANDYINFSFAYLTSEISPSDKFGVFVDGIYSGFLAGSVIDQAHPWMNSAATNLGFGQALYENGNTLNPQLFTLSLRVPNPGSAFEVDFVIADVFGDGIDTAIFLGDFTATTTAQGQVLAIPEPSRTAFLALAGFAWLRRRNRS